MYVYHRDLHVLTHSIPTRRSSDLCTFAARSRFSGVFVAMHHSISDDVIACHIGTRVRKNHTSRRDAFHSIDVYPFSLLKKDQRSEEHTSELQSLMRISYADFCLKTKKQITKYNRDLKNHKK